MFDKRKHDIIQATRKSANKETHRVLNRAGFEVETKGADDAGEDKVMKVVVTRAVEANQVVNMNSWDHVGCVQVEATANTLQMGVGKVRKCLW